MPRWLRIALPPMVVGMAILMTGTLISLRPEQKKKEPEAVYPKVETYTVQEESVRIRIQSQGTVRPRQQTRLTARVSGQIEAVASQFYEGGTFQQGDVLLKLDPLPYRSALAEAKSRLALAESALLQEQEAAEQARRDWEKVGSGEPSPLVLRRPQLDKARADLEAAKVAVEMASQNLSHAAIRAPYNGRIQAKHVDVGQAITAQATVLADIFSIDVLEVPLPLSIDDLALVGTIANSAEGKKPRVTLSAIIAGEEHSWNGYLDRTAASLDEHTRMIMGYAVVEPPYLSATGESLKPGMFVAAGIEGRTLENATKLPRGAVQPGSTAYRLTDNNRLESIHLNIVYTDDKWAISTNTLRPGDRISLTPLLFFVEGMQVEPVGETAQQEPSPTEPTP